MCWSSKSQGMVNICALLVLLLTNFPVLPQFLPSRCSLHLFCIGDATAIRGTHKCNKYIWEFGHSDGSSYHSVRIFYSSLPSPSVWLTYVRTGLFLLFTGTLVISHVRMILRGMTTVETIQMQSMAEREKWLLGQVYAWWEFGWVCFRFNFSFFCMCSF